MPKIPAAASKATGPRRARPATTRAMAGRKEVPSAPAAGPSALQGCTHLKLRRLGRVVARHYESQLAGSGLHINQYSLLSVVVKLGPIGLGELAAVLRLESSTLSRNLQPLVAQGLVEVKIGGDDARSRQAVATAAGRAARSEAQRMWKQAQLALNERLGAERVATLHALLDESLALLEGPAEGDDHE